MHHTNKALYWAALKGIEQSQGTRELSRLEQLQYDNLFNIDQWYSTCQGFTFPTVFLSINGEEIEACIRSYKKNVLHQKDVFEPQDGETLSNLAAQIETTKNQKLKTESIFVRLNARSPKDSGFSNQKMKEILDRKLSGIQQSVSDQEMQNLEFIAFFQSQIESLRVTSGIQALDLLLHSERIFDDLNRALEEHNLNPEVPLQVNLAVREWQSMKISREFRGFVYGRKLTALSQYFDMLHFPDLVVNKKAIQRKIFEFFDSVAHLIPYDNCVMDFGLLDNDSKVVAIEFNPWNRFTSTCLFNWQKDLDVLEGIKDFEFRIVKEPLPVLRQNQKADTQWQPVTINLELAEEASDVLQLVQSYLEDDMERINSNLRYILNKRNKS